MPETLLTCQEDLVGSNINRRIPDKSIRASSCRVFEGDEHQTEQCGAMWEARLDAVDVEQSNVWCARTKGERWIEWNLNVSKRVAGFKIGGSPKQHSWVIKLKISYRGDDVDSWTWYNGSELFEGALVNGRDVRMHWVTPFNATAVRFYIEDFNKWPCMRATLLGCEPLDGEAPPGPSTPKLTPALIRETREVTKCSSSGEMFKLLSFGIVNCLLTVAFFMALKNKEMEVMKLDNQIAHHLGGGDLELEEEEEDAFLQESIPGRAEEKDSQHRLSSIRTGGW